MDTKKIYQWLYEREDLHYGQAKYDRCPGVRYIPKYKKWLEGKIIDFGCGTGDTVKELRKLGYEADGIDQIKLPFGMMYGDITKPNIYNYDTAICIDVFEHIDDEGLEGLLYNMKQCKKQIINVHVKETKSKGPEGEELHINIKTFDEWEKFIKKHLKVNEIIDQGKRRRMFLCSTL